MKATGFQFINNNQQGFYNLLCVGKYYQLQNAQIKTKSDTMTNSNFAHLYQL